MQRILVPTDFSVRSDRGLRRATLLAKRFGASLHLVHVVDPDRPARLVDAERAAAEELLAEQARTLREVDGIDGRSSVAMGDAFAAIAACAEETDSDLVVLGPHRARPLRDTFSGTTAERAIRASRRPVLMALGTPVGHHQRALVATDLSTGSAEAAEALARLGLHRTASISLLSVVAPDEGGIVLAGALQAGTPARTRAEEEVRQAAQALAVFADRLSYKPVTQSVKRESRSVAADICAEARVIGADLIVAGASGRSGVEKMFLGSVASEILRTSDRDVLVVPRRPPDP